MNKQCKRVLAYLCVADSIDPLRSWKEIGVYRLASRISELVEMNIPIQKEWVKESNRYGEKVRFRKYYLTPADKLVYRSAIKEELL